MNEPLAEEGAVAAEMVSLARPPLGVDATFTDAGFERSFRTWSLDATKRQARAAILVAAALTLCFVVSDIAFFGMGRTTARLFALRLAVALPGVALVRPITRASEPRVLDVLVHAWTACVAALVVYLAAARPPGQPLPVVTLAVAMIAVHVFMPTRFVFAGATTLSMTAAYLGFAATRAGALTQFVPMAISLTLANAIGLVVSRSQHRTRRAQYVEFLVERRIAARLREELEIRARVERSLRDAEANLNAAFEAAPFPLAIVRVTDRRVLRRNVALQAMEGARASDAPSPELDALLAAHPELLRSSDASLSAVAEGLFVDAGGTRRHVVASARRIEFFGEPSALLSFVDISARKQTEDALASAKEQAEEASRAKSLFVATASHELRTPLHGIMTAAQLLAATHLSDEQRQWLDLLRMSGHALRRLVDDVLDLSRLQAGGIQLVAAPFAPRALLDEVSVLMRVRAETSAASLRLHLDERLPSVMIGDRGRLQQVLLNIVENALKYGRGGDVDLTVDVIDHDSSRATLRFEVADRGPGIPAAEQAAIFEPFVQLGPSGGQAGGIGLGLAICKHIVAAMGGELAVAPRDGGGSRFSFTIMLEVDTADVTDAPRAPARTTNVRPLRVLLVDDDEIARRLGAQMLLRVGHHVTVAASGPEALDLLGSSTFDVALLDVRMPGLSGDEVAARVRRLSTPARAGLPLVATTANVRPAERAAYLAAGFDRVLAKPLDFDEVAATLESLVCGAHETTPTSADPVPRSGTEATVLLDASLLARHVETMGAAWVDDLLERALVVVPATLGELSAAYERGDARRVRALAHRLAGAAETTGLVRVARAASRLEDAAAIDGAVLAGLVESLEAATSASLGALQRHLRSSSASGSVRRS